MVAISNLSNLAILASFAWVLAIISLWEMVWKGIALWKSGTQKQLVWFVCIFIFNTLGILPIIYLLWFQKKEKPSGHRNNSRGKRNSRSRKK